MASTGLSEYRLHCEDLLKEMFDRPSMWYEHLEGVETFFHGHFVAYNHLCGLQVAQSFNARFLDWLWSSRRIPGGQGWASGICEYATANNKDQLHTFRELVSDFTSHWIENSAD